MIDAHKPALRTSKRLIVCCDGTWMNSDNGYEKPSFRNPKGTLQVPSNVTRISRCFKRRCKDGVDQVISYESGVGTGSNTVDEITGGAFGLGLSERVRESYSYLCANYTSKDEIFLVGFSRGAFTARSVAGMVSNLGLLTREGVEHFYPIFKDMQNWMDDDYDDPFPNIPFSNKPKGPKAAEEYRSRLEKMGYTRVNQKNGDLIKIKAVCVWDSWHDTSLSNRIEHAFQALALDETRPPFSPAVWERTPENKNTTDLRQVWFAGAHSDCGGGNDDLGVANCSLAWMIDQMASVGVEFDKPSLDRIFKRSAEYYQALSAKDVSKKNKGKAKAEKALRWAVNPIYENNLPQRPWALGAIHSKVSLLYWISGKTSRTPGLYKQTDPKTDLDSDRFLQDTNERVHSSVRVRLACKGLDLNDKAIWTCSALSGWKLVRSKEKYNDPVPQHPSWDPVETAEETVENSKGRWVWEYAGDEKHAPPNRVMVEEPLGPYERYLLKLAGGTPNVYDFADIRDMQ